MATPINIQKIKNSKISSVDFNNIPFGKVFSDHMFVADYKNGQWGDYRIEPISEISIHPGNLAWHYGQSIFEGMKATALPDGTPLLLRPEKHIERLNRSAVRMSMPEFPEDMFLEAIRSLVSIDRDWIPKTKGSALYLRPLMIAMDEAIGVRPSQTYKLMIMALPVGPYYPKPVSLLAEEKYVRAASGGVGEAKTAGNYAASLYPAKLAKEKGFDQIMWLDAKEFKYIQEVGTMNIFFVIDGEVHTPIAGGTILRGITRLTAIEILRSEGYTVHERNIEISELIEAYNSGKLQEVFGTGTAAVVASVNKIMAKGSLLEFDVEQYKVAPLIKNYIEELRSGERKDTFGWVEEVKREVLA